MPLSQHEPDPEQRMTAAVNDSIKVAFVLCSAYPYHFDQNRMRDVANSQLKAYRELADSELLKLRERHGVYTTSGIIEALTNVATGYLDRWADATNATRQSLLDSVAARTEPGTTD